MLVQTDTRISLKGSFIMSTIIVELIELEIEKIDSAHLVQFLAVSTCISNMTHIKADEAGVLEKVIFLKLICL